jgi:hypothetical protein
MLANKRTGCSVIGLEVSRMTDAFKDATRAALVVHVGARFVPLANDLLSRLAGEANDGALGCWFIPSVANAQRVFLVLLADCHIRNGQPLYYCSYSVTGLVGPRR